MEGVERKMMMMIPWGHQRLQDDGVQMVTFEEIQSMANIKK